MTITIQHIEKYYPFIWVILFFISYLFLYPENWMITDAYNYVNRGIAFSSGTPDLFITDFIDGNKINLIPAPYNTGTSFFFGMIIAILGKQSIFLVPLFQVILSVFFISKTIDKNKYSNYGLLVMAFSLSLMFFSRSAMSCIPSLMLISIACYLFFRNELKNKHVILLGFVAGISLWFRESNIFLIAPFVIHLFYKHRQSIPMIGLGGFLGLSPKVIMDKWVYDTFWFSSASSGFSVDSILDHIPEYAIILVVLIPLSILFIVMHQGKGDKSIKVASTAFILLYLLYNYSAVDYSGLLKGSFLTSRFMIPLLPVVAICASEVINRKKPSKKLLALIAIFSLVCIPSSQYLFHKMYQGHENASRELNKLTASKYVFADFSGYTNIIRYYNPLNSDLKNASSIQHLKEQKLLKENQLILLSKSIASKDKQFRGDSINSFTKHLELELVKKIPIDDKNWLEVHRGK